MNESGFKAATKAKCRGHVNIENIESPTTGVGIPDCVYSTKQARGWIEVKYRKEWPVRENTMVALAHFTPEQKAFLLKEGDWAGYCFLLIRVDKHILLFDHANAQMVGKLTRYEMITRACGVWVVGKFNPIEFADRLNVDHRHD